MRTILIGLAFTGLLLGGCGGSNDSESGGGGAILVTGTVRDQGSVPIPFVVVVIPGHPPAATDVNGAFQIAGVETPYSVILFDPPDGDLVVYEGLTRPDPTLEGLVLLPLRTANVSGSLSGGFPQPPMHGNLASSASDHSGGGSATVASDTDGSFAFVGTSWRGPLQTTFHVAGLQWQKDATGQPVSYTGFGTQDILLHDGDDLTMQDVLMGPVGTGTISGTRTAPPGYLATFKSASLNVRGRVTIGLGSDNSPLDTFSFAVPDAPGSARTVSAGASSPSGFFMLAVRQNLPTSAGDVVVVIPETTEFIAPAHGAVDVDYDTLFQLTPFPDRVHIVRFQTVGLGPDFTLYTSESTFRLPDLTTLGFGIPPGTPYTWDITVRGPHADLDDVTGPEGILPASAPFLFRETGDPRNFTTAP